MRRKIVNVLGSVVLLLGTLSVLSALADSDTVAPAAPASATLPEPPAGPNDLPG